MSQNQEVIQKILALLDTIQEGFQHIQYQVKELRYEEAFSLLEDSLMGIASIESAIKPMENKIENLVNPDLIRHQENLYRHINQVVDQYQSRKYQQLDERLEQVTKTFKIWKATLEQILIPYILS